LRGGWCVRVIIIDALEDINRAGVTVNINRPTFDPLELGACRKHGFKLWCSVTRRPDECSALLGVLAKEDVTTGVWIRNSVEVRVVSSPRPSFTQAESLIADLASVGIFHSHATPSSLRHPLNVRCLKCRCPFGLGCRETRTTDAWRKLG
jgi:hypothetical protein